MTEEFKDLYHKFLTKGEIQPTDSFIDKSKELFSTFDSANKAILSDKYPPFAHLLQTLVYSEFAKGLEECEHIQWLMTKMFLF